MRRPRVCAPLAPPEDANELRRSPRCSVGRGRTDPSGASEVEVYRPGLRCGLAVTDDGRHPLETQRLSGGVDKDLIPSDRITVNINV